MAKITKVTAHSFRALARAQTRVVLLADFRRLAEVAESAASDVFTSAQLRELVGIVPVEDVPADDGAPLSLKHFGRRVAAYMDKTNRGYGGEVFSVDEITAARLGEVG